MLNKIYNRITFLIPLSSYKNYIQESKPLEVIFSHMFVILSLNQHYTNIFQGVFRYMSTFCDEKSDNNGMAIQGFEIQECCSNRSEARSLYTRHNCRLVSDVWEQYCSIGSIYGI